MKLYNTKKIICKTMTEYIICLDDFISYDYKVRTKYNRRKFDELTEEEQEESKIRQDSYYKRKIFDIERFIDCNYNDESTFLTLTFARNLQDLAEANKEFNLFIKRLNYYLRTTFEDFKSLKYIAIWERQQRGAIHYHVILFNLPFVDAKKLEEIWGNGFIRINLIEDDKKEKEKKKSKKKQDKKASGIVSDYLTKYFVKDVDERVREKKAYFSSRNLERPKEQKQRLTDDEINEILVDDKDILRQKEFDSKAFIGMVGKEKTFKNVRKIYIKKTNKNFACKNTKNVLKFESKSKDKKSYFKNKITPHNS